MNVTTAQHSPRTLKSLIDRQSASFRKHPAYPSLSRRLDANQSLARVRLGKTAFLLLDRARLKSEHLENFYRTYRLPRDPFFPLFLLIKRELAEKRKAAAREKAAAIAAVVDALPSEVRAFIVFLAKLEARFNPACPLWKANLYPRTKKRAAEFARYSIADWIALFGPYLEALRRRYVNRPELRQMDGEKLLACMALGCLPDPATLRWPTEDEVKSRYRALVKTLHPDAGGDDGMFRLVSLAKETLLTEA